MNAESLVAIGRTFFALGLLGLGVEHFVFQEFVTGRAPAWPNGMPGNVGWMYGTGILIIAVGVSILSRRWARQALLGFGFLVFVWALLRHVPIAAADALLAGSWTQTGKALTFVGGSLAVAGTMPPIPNAAERRGWRYANATGAFMRVGAICLGCFLIVSGLQHFKFTSFVATLIPSWIPGNVNWWVWFAGAALIAGGLGLLIKQTARLAGLMTGLMIFSWFCIVHVPRMFVSRSDTIAVFEALAFAGVALVVAGAVGERR